MNVPGPPSPPFIPGHLGCPSYAECAEMLLVLSVYEAAGEPLPPALAWKIGPWRERLMEWCKREIERGNLDALLSAVTGEQS